MKKRTGIAAMTLIGITMAASSVGVPAAETAANETDMGKAVDAALADAGLTKDAVTFTKKLNEFQNGGETYVVDFIVPSETKYEYTIDAASGAVIGREEEAWEAEDDLAYKALLAESKDYFDLDADAVSSLITDSMMAARGEAGITDEMDYEYYKLGMDYEEGVVLCKVGILLPGKTKYEYGFDAATGKLFETETDAWEAEDDAEYAALLPTAGEGQAAAADTGAVTEDKAKQIALADAGFAEGDVRMQACGKDFDDGAPTFEVSFVTADGMEYDYEISAADGSILSKDAEYDD